MFTLSNGAVCASKHRMVRHLLLQPFHFLFLERSSKIFSDRFSLKQLLLPSLLIPFFTFNFQSKIDKFFHSNFVFLSLYHLLIFFRYIKSLFITSKNTQTKEKEKEKVIYKFGVIPTSMWSFHFKY